MEMNFNCLTMSTFEKNSCYENCKQEWLQFIIKDFIVGLWLSHIAIDAPFLLTKLCAHDSYLISYKMVECSCFVPRVHDYW